MEFRECWKPMIVGGIAGIVINLAYAACIAGGMENKDWLGLVGTVLGAGIAVWLTIQGTIYTERRKERLQIARQTKAVTDALKIIRAFLQALISNPSKDTQATIYAIHRAVPTLVWARDRMENRSYRIQSGIQMIVDLWEIEKPSIDAMIEGVVTYPTMEHRQFIDKLTDLKTWFDNAIEMMEEEAHSPISLPFVEIPANNPTVSTPASSEPITER